MDWQRWPGKAWYDRGMTYVSRHVSVAIERPPADVYAFAGSPENLPRWAAGLGGSVTREGPDWVAESPMGRVTVRFADANDLGVLDHVVTLPSGEAVYNPMRVFGNDTGSEVVFTVYRRPGTTEEQFAADAAQVGADLHQLKTVLEPA
jgi:Polyketide cyclase / dehydrase and lipid transport